MLKARLSWLGALAPSMPAKVPTLLSAPSSSQSDAPQRPLIERLLARVVEVERGEIPALLYAFATFFAVLTAYYIIRPVRDEMAVMLGRETLEHLFLYIFVVMLAAVPAFGAVVRDAPRRLVLPAVYGFFIVTLLGFWLVLVRNGQTRSVAQAFFIWASVFNLFIVSLFWSLMAEVWRSGQAKRLFGFITAGGSCGALMGPFIAQALVKQVGTDTLLLLSAAFLGVALVLAVRLRAHRDDGQGAAAVEAEDTAARARDSGILAGAMLVWRSPYLFRIALWVLLANVIVTYFYLEQARIVGATIADRAERVQLLSRIDLAVSVATILMQVFLTARVIKRFGLGLAAASVPAISIAGFVALAIAPVMGVILVVMVAERAVGFPLANPAARVLWTVVEPEAKYKAQNFVDTVIFRGGDAASGWVFGGLSKGLGFGGAGIACVAVPFAVVWLVLSFVLARMQAERAADQDRDR